MTSPSDPPSNLNEGQQQALHALARMLATGSVDKNADQWTAQAALLNLPEAFDWLRKLFARINTEGQALRWFSPHRVQGELSQHTLAFAVGPANGSPEENTAFYRLDDGRLTKVEPITNEDELFPRLNIVLAWDARNKLAQMQANWSHAIMRCLRDDVRSRASHHPVEYVRRMVEEIGDNDSVQLPEIVLAYLTLGLSPRLCIAEALTRSSLDLPIPLLEEPQQ